MPGNTSTSWGREIPSVARNAAMRVSSGTALEEIEMKSLMARPLPTWAGWGDRRVYVSHDRGKCRFHVGCRYADFMMNFDTLDEQSAFAKPRKAAASIPFDIHEDLRITSSSTPTHSSAIDFNWTPRQTRLYASNPNADRDVDCSTLRVRQNNFGGVDEPWLRVIGRRERVPHESRRDRPGRTWRRRRTNATGSADAVRISSCRARSPSSNASNDAQPIDSAEVS